MLQREALWQTALQWLDTPYHPEACVRQVGVDCAMLLVGIGQDCGLVARGWRPPHYSPEWHLHQRVSLLGQTVLRLGGRLLVPKESAQPGDILLFTFGRTQSHAAILLPGNLLLHATLQDRRVVRHGFVGDWRARWALSCAYPGVR